MAVVFAAAGIKFPVLYFFPGRSNLLGDRCNICRTDNYFFFTIVFLFVRFNKVEVGNGHGPSDDEGRVIQLDFGDTRLINAYFPSGTSGDERQDFKYAWLDECFAWLNKLKKKHPKLILCGDYNIAPVSYTHLTLPTTPYV